MRGLFSIPFEGLDSDGFPVFSFNGKMCIRDSFMCYFFFYCFSKIQNKKAKVNSREYLLDVYKRQVLFLLRLLLLLRTH